MKHLREFAAFFAVQLVVYGLLTWNYRAVAQARYGNIFVSDLTIAAINFVLIKRVATANTKAAWIGYTLGGAIGSVCAAWITKAVYGQ